MSDTFDNSKSIKVKKARRIFGANDWVCSLVSALFVVIILLAFIFRIVMVKGDSMLPTLHDTERLIISSIVYNPEYGDIIVLKTEGENAHPIIKRVIATEGQKVVIDYNNDMVSVYDKDSDQPVVLNEPYINEADMQWHNNYLPAGSEGEDSYYSYDDDYNSVVAATYTVPEGCYFVLGDNRNNSKDSRSPEVGYVKKNQILGEVLLRFLPFNEFSLAKDF